MCGWWLVVVGFLHHVCPSVFYPNYNTNHHPPSTITGSQWDTDESTPSSLGSGVTVLKIQVGFIYLHIYAYIYTLIHQIYIIYIHTHNPPPNQPPTHTNSQVGLQVAHTHTYIPTYTHMYTNYMYVCIHTNLPPSLMYQHPTKHTTTNRWASRWPTARRSPPFWASWTTSPARLMSPRVRYVHICIIYIYICMYVCM